MPTATFRHSVRSPADVDQIWAALQDPRTWEHVGPVEKVWDPEFDDDGTLVGYRWSTSIGSKEYEGHAHTIEHRRGECFRIDLDGGEMGGILAAELDPGPDGTDIDVTLEIRTQGMMSSLLFPAIRGAIASGFPEQVESLTRRISGLEDGA